MKYSNDRRNDKNAPISRRSFVEGAAATLMIVPRHVLGGSRFVPPSDKITVACIGVGAQGTRVLKFSVPETVEATSTKLFPETYPAACIMHFSFGARGDLPPVKVHWYDGGLTPPRVEGIPDDYVLTGENHEGMLFVGDKGSILCGFNGSQPRLIPESRMKSFQPPPKTLPRSKGAYREWIDACKGGGVASANFEFEAPIVATILLGNIAVRTQKKLTWDSTNLKITNVPDANKHIDFEYRDAFKALV
jgi:hypothetical protein